MREVLALEQLEESVFRRPGAEGATGRVFGGEVVAQALVAAGTAVPRERAVHSLHGYFLRGGDPAVPLLFHVATLREGRSFTVTRVDVLQHGLPIFTLTASFQVPEKGLEHQSARLDAPSAADLPDAAQRAQGPQDERQQFLASLLAGFPLDVRFPEAPPGATSRGIEAAEPRHRLWVRSTDLPDDALLHAAAATFASDLFLLAAGLPPHAAALHERPVQVASLDHAVWFHAPFRADAWLLYEQEGPRAAGGRMLTRGVLLDAQGVHVATVTQEGLVRLRG